MEYRVVLRPAADRQLKRQHGAIGIALRGAILRLGEEPRPRAATKLVGSPDLWRLRIRIDGRPWRIIYQLDDASRLVRVVRVASRDEATYRGLR